MCAAGKWDGVPKAASDCTCEAPAEQRGPPTPAYRQHPANTQLASRHPSAGILPTCRKYRASMLPASHEHPPGPSIASILPMYSAHAGQYAV
eukprot:353206-Chlamydomonas_euryale.AAC.20